MTQVAEAGPLVEATGLDSTERRPLSGRAADRRSSARGSRQIRRSSIAGVEEHGGSGHWVALGERVWHIETVWRAALDLPVEEVPIYEIREIDEDCWFGGRPATVRDVVSHARRIVDADLSLPVILASDGQVLDGMHRIAKAVLCGQISVAAQRLATDPDPDWLRSGEQSQ